jgi:sphingomyelin phosphodiesterase
MKNAVIQTLNYARINSEKVIVINHHPPGSGDYIIAESKWYEQVMINFKDVVVLQVAGHTHTDEFRLLKTADNKVESMVYVSPSIDMNHFRNPSIRVYHLNSTTFELLDYDHYYFDLASATGTTPPEIVHLYSAKEAYGLTDMKPESWEQLLYRFSTDQDLLVKHRRHSYAAAGWTATNPPCDQNCLRGHVCRQLHANYDHYLACLAGPPQPPGPTEPSSTWPPLTRPPSTPTLRREP